MKFTVEKLPQAETEINSLEHNQQELLRTDYSIIETQGIEFVRVKPIQKDIFEIKTCELRSLFKYKKGRIIIIGVVFVKKTKKTPKEKIKLAKQRYKGRLIMDFVFIKDSEGYVFKKLKNEIHSDEKIISEKKYMKLAGLTSYEKKFGHGGARKNAGRKQKFALPLKFQIRVTKEEKDFISYAREHNVDYTALMQM